MDRRVGEEREREGTEINMVFASFLL